MRASDRRKVPATASADPVVLTPVEAELKPEKGDVRTVLAGNAVDGYWLTVYRFSDHWDRRDHQHVGLDLEKAREARAAARAEEELRQSSAMAEDDWPGASW